MTNLIDPTKAGEYQVFLSGISQSVLSIIEKIYRSDEVGELSKHIENNPWHDNENVLTHVETVFTNIQTLLEFQFIYDPGLKDKYLKFMDEKIYRSTWMTRKEALLIACALHDLSKGQKRPAGDLVAPGKTYLFVKEDGTTSGKGHEHASALMVLNILDGQGLNDKEIEWIADLVDDHDQFSLDYCNLNLSGYKNGDVKSDVEKIKSDQPDKCVELLLHIIADEWGAEISMWKTKYLRDDVLSNHFLG